jgi:exosortase A
MPDLLVRSGRWPQALAMLVVLLLATLGLYYQTATGMVNIWSRSETYAHGFVVPLISLWLIWRIRHSLAAYVPKPAPLAGLLMLGAAGVWLAGDLVAVNSVTQFALVALLVLAVPTVLGWQLARAMAFPLGFLFFAVPFGDFMMPKFMDWTADFTVLALRATGIPVYREGLQFVIPSGNWSVVEACSGIRYLIASVTVGCLFAYLSYRSLTKRLIFVGVAILVPLVANWLRAYMIVMIGHLSGNELATGVDHLIYGWVFFGIVILLMLMIGARWADAPEPAGAPPAGSRAAKPLMGSAAAATRSLAIATGAALLVAVSPHAAQRLLALSVNTDPVQFAPLTVQPPWQTAAQSPISWAPSFKFASATTQTSYLSPQGQAFGVHVSYYRDQDYERKLVSSENVLVPSSDAAWVQVASGSASATLGGQTLQVSAATLREQGAALASSNERLQVWRFYWVNGKFTASGITAKLQGALSRATGQGDDSAIVALYTPLNREVPEAQAREQATERLQDFLKTQGPALQQALQATRGAH